MGYLRIWLVNMFFCSVGKKNAGITRRFPAATANWGPIGWFEIWSALTAGNRLFWGPLVDPTDGVTQLTRTVLGGDIVRFTAGVVQVQAT
jgi:hypothetical protein